MKYNKIKLSDFVQKDRFELNSYLTCLLMQFNGSSFGSSEDSTNTPMDLAFFIY